MDTSVRLSSVLLLLSLIPWPGRAVAPAAPSAADAAAVLAARAQESRLPRIVPGQVLVQLRDSVTLGAEALFRRGGSFRNATADRSSSLDVLFRELTVRAVRPVFRKEEEVLVPVIELRRRDAEAAREAMLGSPERSRRVRGPAQVPELFHVYLLELGPGVDPAAAADALGRDPHVVYAEPNRVSFTQAALPNDPLIDPRRLGTFHVGTWWQHYADLWGVQQIGWGEVWSGQKTLWRDARRRGGGGITVAVVDTGADVLHPDLAANVWRDAQGHPGRDVVHVPPAFWEQAAKNGFGRASGEDYRTPDNDPADKVGHGTHVAGTIAAVANNREGIAGVAWGSRLMPVRAGFALRDVFNDTVGGALLDDNIAAGIRWAAEHGADVINMSFGRLGESRTVSLALDRAHALGVALVASAGNSAADVKDFFPASSRHVVSVAATHTGDRRIYFTNWGEGIDVAAPGSDIASALVQGLSIPGGGGTGGIPGYVRLSGTSMASPHVAAALALVLSAFPGLGPDEAAARVVGTADPVSGFVFRDGKHVALGSGRLNVLRALTAPAGAVIVLRSWEILSDTDGDGSAEPGEDVRVQLSLDNVWRTARNVSVKLVAGPQATVVRGATLQVGSWPMGKTQTLTVDLAIGGNVPWGLEGVFGLEIRGGTQQDLPLPLALRGPGVKAGWPGLGVQNGDGMSASPVLADLDGHGDREVIAASDLGDILVRDAGGAVLPAWPQRIASFAEQSSPLVEDFDGDGHLDVALIRAKKLHVLGAQGQELPGWPQDVADYVLCSPAAGDVDGDGDLEIVTLAQNGELSVFDATGHLLPGWPQTIGIATNTTPVLADLDPARPGLEILAATYRDGSLYALHGDGTALSGSWPLKVGPAGPASPAVADLDGDGELDIVFSDAFGFVSRIDRQGRMQPLGRAPGVFGFSSPAVGDLDGDGDLEIVLGSGNLDGSGFISALDADGHVLPGWPVATADHVSASPALADLDGDGRPEVIVPDLSGEIWVLRADGRPLGGWPADVNAWTISSPVVADLDGDGTAEIVQGRVTLGLKRTPVPMTEVLEFGKGAGASWPTFKKSSQRTGVE